MVNPYQYPQLPPGAPGTQDNNSAGMLGSFQQLGGFGPQPNNISGTFGGFGQLLGSMRPQNNNPAGMLGSFQQLGGYGSPYDGGGPMFGGLMNSLGKLDPGKIYIDQIASDFTNEQLNQYGQNVGRAANYMQQAGQAGIAGYQGINQLAQNTADQLSGAASGFGAITQGYGQSANALRQYGNQAADQNMQFANQGAQAQLGNLTGMLGMYRNAANQAELPGQRLIEQNLGATTSQALNRVREFGGGSQGALGAISNIYGGQVGAQRDLGLQAAQYQDQNRQNYMGALSGAGQQYGNIYNNLGNAAMASGNMRGSAEQAAAGMYGGAQERQLANQQNVIQQAGQMRAMGQQGLTEAQQGAAQNMGNFYNNLAPQTAGMLSNLQSQRLNAEMTQQGLSRQAILDSANMMGQGLQTGAQYQDQAWQQNQMNPYQNMSNYWNQFISGGGGLNAGYGQMNAALGMQNQAWNNYNQNMSGWGQAAGAGAQMGMQAAQYVPWGEIFKTASSAVPTGGGR